MTKKSSLIFLSYAKEDLTTARRIHQELESRNLKVWFDERDLGVGAWKPQITKAIARSRFFVFCVSERALDRIDEGEGFQDQELTEAYQLAINQIPGRFTIVPIRLERCGYGDHRLAMFNQFDLLADWDGVLDRVAMLMGGDALAGAKPESPDFGSSQEANEHFATGASLLMVGDLSRALAEFDAALEAAPRHADALSLRATVRYLQEDYKPALADYDESLWLQPRSHLTRHNLGILRFAMGQYEEALKEIARSLVLSPNETQYNLSMAAILARLGRCEESEKFCYRALSNSSAPAKTILEAYGYLCLCSFDRALALLDKGLEKHAESSTLWYQKLKHPTIMCDAAQGRSITTKLIELEPGESYFWSLHAHFLSIDLAAGHNFDEPLDAQEEAIRLAADPSEELWRKGNLLCLIAILRAKQADHYYQRALESYESGLGANASALLTGEILHNKAIVLAKLQREEEALEVAEQSAQMGVPVDPQKDHLHNGRFLR
jgi:tetratricopeptide (TPR) repeat protein